MVVEAAYVGNRGAWWTAPLLSALNYDGITPQQLQSQYGLNVKNPTDASLLLTPISSPSVIARFPIWQIRTACTQVSPPVNP